MRPLHRPLPARLRTAAAGLALAGLLACAPEGGEGPGDQELRGPGTGLENETAPPNPGQIDPDVLDSPQPGQMQPEPTEGPPN